MENYKSKQSDAIRNFNLKDDDLIKVPDGDD